MINPSNPALGADADSSNQNLSPEQQKLMRLYGKVPKVPLARHLMGGRKYFDSGDYALAKAGDKNVIVGEDHKEVTVGKDVPLPAARVPARAPPRASALHQSTTSRLKEVAVADEQDEQEDESATGSGAEEAEESKPAGDAAAAAAAAAGASADASASTAQKPADGPAPPTS